MYSSDKGSSLSREEKSRKYRHHQYQRNHPINPSFSSSLLDEIYRSIDGRDGPRDHHHHNQQDLKLVYTERNTISAKKHGKMAGPGGAAAAAVEDSKMGRQNGDFLVEKWMEKEINHKTSRKSHNYNRSPLFLHLEDDPLFFSSTSSSSESSNSSGLSSSSDTEFYAASVKTSKSCFTTIKKPKPVKTKKQSEFSMADYEASKSSDHKTEEENLIKSQSRALKIYSNLKKVKDPISPGGRLTAFINNLFTNSKKHGSHETNNTNVPSIPVRKSTKYSSNNIVSPPPSSTFSSACSTASSFSRSCLSKKSLNSRLAKNYNDGIKRTVRFYPVSVIVDQDSRPCGHKHIHDVHDNNCDKPLVRQTPTTLSSQKAAAESNKILNLKLCQGQTKEKNLKIQAEEMEKDFDYDDEYDDGASDCSSDLFEIDHLALFGNGRFREELPVYETTHLDTSRQSPVD